MGTNEKLKEYQAGSRAEIETNGKQDQTAVEEADRPNLVYAWMYADLPDFHVAYFNPCRWSVKQKLEAVLAELEEENGARADFARRVHIIEYISATNEKNKEYQSGSRAEIETNS